MRVGPGDALELSPDGQWLLAVTASPPMRLLLHPTGPGASRELVNPDEIVIENALALRQQARGRLRADCYHANPWIRAG